MVISLVLTIGIAIQSSSLRSTINWIQVDSGLFPGLSSKIASIDEVMFKRRASPRESLKIARPFLDSQNLVLIKSQESRKGLTYLVDLNHTSIFVDYFLSPPDSFLFISGKHALLWAFPQSQKFAIAVSQWGLFPYCANRFCIRPQSGGIDSCIDLGEDFPLDSAFSLQLYNQQVAKPCELHKFVRVKSGCLNNPIP